MKWTALFLFLITVSASAQNLPAFVCEENSNAESLYVAELFHTQEDYDVLQVFKHNLSTHEKKLVSSRPVFTISWSPVIKFANHYETTKLTITRPQGHTSTDFKNGQFVGIGELLLEREGLPAVTIPSMNCFYQGL